MERKIVWDRQDVDYLTKALIWISKESVLQEEKIATKFYVFFSNLTAK